MSVGESEDVRELRALILESIARELNVAPGSIPLEVEQVVSTSLFEMARRAQRRVRRSSTKMPIVE